MNRCIRLRGLDGDVEGKNWESDTILRAGRLATLEIVLEDSSVSRRHAEIRATDNGWRVRDLDSTNGTFLNGAKLGPGESPVRPNDIVRFGNVTLVVEVMKEDREKDEDASPIENMQVAAVGNQSWEDAISFPFEREKNAQLGHQLQALLRAGHHLVHLESEDKLLSEILRDAVSTLKAQRGAIVLAETPDSPLRLRAQDTGSNQIASRTAFSQSLANRCFDKGQSILCCSVEEDAELLGAKSIAEGAMSSVLCVVLRTPRKKLGVLHLDRGPMNEPFTPEDMKFADALAAHVSFGIECAQLLRRQRDFLYQTISTLAQAVEIRDEYTAGHTRRVTEYSLLLATHLECTPKKIHQISIGTPLHDIGKIGIDDAILRKPSKLTPVEFEIMKTHTVMGAKMLAEVNDLAEVIPIVRSHHERWDGGGYPDGLAGEKIHRLARIVAVADAFDAMTSARPYRKAMPVNVAFAEIQKNLGKQFDPEIGAGFIKIKQRIVQEMNSETKRIHINQLATLRLADV